MKFRGRNEADESGERESRVDYEPEPIIARTFLSLREIYFYYSAISENANFPFSRNFAQMETSQAQVGQDKKNDKMDKKEE